MVSTWIMVDYIGTSIINEQCSAYSLSPKGIGLLSFDLRLVFLMHKEKAPYLKRMLTIELY